MQTYLKHVISLVSLLYLYFFASKNGEFKLPAAAPANRRAQQDRQVFDQKYFI